MSRAMTQARRPRATVFCEAAQEVFAYLTSVGFVGPLIHNYELVYTSDEFSVHVIYDERERYVTTKLDGAAGRAGLRCLYVHAGLGPAQRVREIVRNKKTLQTALESQGAALQKLLPRLGNSDGPALIANCHGR